jgi:hypothetical protein
MKSGILVQQIRQMQTSRLRTWPEPVKKRQQPQTNLQLKRNRNLWGLPEEQCQPTGEGWALLPLLRWTKKLRHSFRAAKRTIFAPDGMLYKLVLWTNRARLWSKPTSWSQEQ